MRSIKIAAPLVLLGALLAIALAAGLALGGQGPAPAQVALTACQANLHAATQLFGRADALSAAFAVPAGTLATWQENRGGLNGPHPTSRWRSVVPSQILYVCYYDGVFPLPAGPPGPNGQVKPPYDRIDVIVDSSGGMTLDRAGHKANLPITDPAKP